MQQNNDVLSKDPRQAVEEMLKLTEALVARIEVETNAAATNDGTTYSMNEMDKEQAALQYEKAANEFHSRLREFERVDTKLIERLQNAQKSLKQTTKNNLRILEKIQAKQ